MGFIASAKNRGRFYRERLNRGMRCFKNRLMRYYTIYFNDPGETR
jgi:hypothetical protein